MNSFVRSAPYNNIKNNDLPNAGLLFHLPPPTFSFRPITKTYLFSSRNRNTTDHRPQTTLLVSSHTTSQPPRRPKANNVVDEPTAQRHDPVDAWTRLVCVAFGGARFPEP